MKRVISDSKSPPSALPGPPQGGITVPGTGDNLTWLLATVLMAVFWLTLARFDYPAPHGSDDLVFIGPATGLLDFHELRNPYLEEYNRQYGYQSAKFYQFPPFHAYVLLAWIKFFTLSAASLLCFQAFCNLAFTAFFGLCLRNFGFGVVCALGSLPLYAFYMRFCGLRPESLSFACVAAGVWVLSRRDFKGSIFGGATLLCTAVMLHPGMIFFGFFLGAGLVILKFKSRPGTPAAKASAIIAQTAFAAALVGGLFLLSIEGDLRRFLTDFGHHSSIAGVAPGTGPAMQFIFEILGHRSNKFTNLPIAIFSGILVVRGVWSNRNNLRSLMMAASLTAAAICYAFLVRAAYYRLWPVFFVLVVMGWAAASSDRDTGRRRLLVSAYALLFCLQILPCSIIQLRGGKPEVAHLQAIRSEVLSHTNAVVILGDEASRYVFDHKYHPGFLAELFTIGKPSSITPQLIRESLSPETLKRASAVLVVLPVPDPPVKLFGIVFNSLQASQFHFQILTFPQ